MHYALKKEVAEGKSYSLLPRGCAGVSVFSILLSFNVSTMNIFISEQEGGQTHPAL